MALTIITDSGADLPLSFYQENNVILLSLKVQLDGNEYDDLIEIEPSTIYQAMRDGKVPKTAQVPPNKFEELFTEMAKNKQDGVYIAFSSGLSGTYSTAIMVLNQVKEDYPDFNLTVIDSTCASLGHGLLVMEAVRLVQQSVDKEKLVSQIEFISHHMESLVSVHELDYLARGGRLSKASAFVGGLLNIKPLIDMEDGKLVPIEKLRGKKKVLNRIIELMKERGEQLDQQIIGISHAEADDTLQEIKMMINETFHPKEIVITDIGSAIGAHTGPGTIAIFFLNKMPS
ncbi:DegV family protein [Bacillus marasmi]|uniref:DegV family protein n=1 Tax=Bacillus marasmi TaxID=1926279 RepID=UPI0011CB9E8A|nr:DegV family protein [Bacillus marasmi]